MLAILFLAKLVFPFPSDPDFYWHIKTGEYFLANGSLQMQDMFAFTSSPTDGVLAEWLSQVILFLVFHVAGFKGIDGFVALLITLYSYVTYMTCRKLLAGDEGKAVMVTLLFCILASIVAPRPHIFTFLLFSILLYLLIDFKYFKDDRHLWVIPIMMLLWANLHGGFFIGLVLLGTFLSSEWLLYLLKNKSDPSQNKRLRRLTGFALASCLATAANPDGFHYWLYPFQMIFKSSDMDNIDEWLSPNFHMPFFQYYLATVFVFFICMIYAKKKPDLTEVLIPLIYISGSFISVRNLPLAGLAMAPFFSIIYKNLPINTTTTTASRSPTETLQLETFGSAGNRQMGSKEGLMNWLLLGFSLGMLVLMYPIQEKKLATAREAAFPEKATDFIVQNGIRGRLFNDHNYGGYLIYRLYPEQKIFFYGRHDVFPAGFMEEYNGIYRGEPGWEVKFDKYDIDYVLCNRKAPLRQLLLTRGRFSLVYDDANNSVLLRNSPQFRDLISKYGIAQK